MTDSIEQDACPECGLPYVARIDGYEFVVEVESAAAFARCVSDDDGEGRTVYLHAREDMIPVGSFPSDQDLRRWTSGGGDRD